MALKLLLHFDRKITIGLQLPNEQDFMIQITIKIVHSQTWILYCTIHKSRNHQCKDQNRQMEMHVWHWPTLKIWSWYSSQLKCFIACYSVIIHTLLIPAAHIGHKQRTVGWRRALRLTINSKSTCMPGDSRV